MPHSVSAQPTTLEDAFSKAPLTELIDYLWDYFLQGSGYPLIPKGRW